MRVTYYLDVISSWCHWAEPAWAELKRRYAGRVDFTWKIALLGGDGLPATRAQEEWFYQRSGTLVRSPYRLSAAWFEPGWTEYLAPNAVAEAARDLGVTGDEARLALAHAAMREGRRVGQWEEAVGVVSKACGLSAGTLADLARSPAIEARMRASTVEFHDFKMTQRPSFLLENTIGDRVLISGLVAAAPLIASVETLLHDQQGYASYLAHHGPPPAG